MIYKLLSGVVWGGELFCPKLFRLSNLLRNLRHIRVIRVMFSALLFLAFRGER